MKNLIDKKDEQTSTSWLLDDQLGSWSFDSAQARENYDPVVAAAKSLINLIFTAMTHKRRSTACVTPSVDLTTILTISHHPYLRSGAKP